MCRIAGYLGPPVPLAELLTSRPRSLRAQAKSPRELPAGMIGSDGFGVGWFVDGRSDPARYRHTLPIWVDENVASMTAHIVASSFVASSRTATDEMPVALTNTPPFLAQKVLLVHNGSIRDFHRGAMDRLRGELRPETRARVLGNSDSEHVAGLLADTDPSRDLVFRVRALLASLDACVRAVGTSAQLTLVVAEPTVMVAVRHGLDARPPALHWQGRGGGTFVASEPMDEEPDWRELAPEQMLVVRTTGASVETL